MEPREYVLNPSPQPEVSREDVSGGLGLCIGYIIENSRSLSKDFKDDGGGQELKRSFKNLIRRTAILAEGIDPNADSDQLVNFTDYLKKYTGVMEESLSIAGDNYMLANMVERYGLGIQTNMDRNQLLSETARVQLKQPAEQVEG